MSEQNATHEQLLVLRQKIDNADEQIQALINQRAGYAAEVAKVKKGRR